MISIGIYNDLTIAREVSIGLYLKDEEGESVLLPRKYCPESYELDTQIRVFVYLDHEERKIATTLTPKIQLHQFARLRVAAIEEVGIFMDWGLEKHLMLPYRERREDMKEGREYLVYMAMDEKTNRLYASNRIERHLHNRTLTVEEGDQVEIIIYQKTDLGFSVIINHLHKGLIYDNEIFQKMDIGDQLSAYVKKIREGNRVDLSLQPIGYRQFNDRNALAIFQALKENEGFLPLTDKSDPEQIYAHFGISKKAFKKAIGALYKSRKISLERKGIRLR